MADELDVEKVEGSEGPRITDPSARYAPTGKGNGPWYLWSRIGKTRDEQGLTRTWFTEGDKVTAKDLGVSDEEFQSLIDDGVVREKKWPVADTHRHLSTN